MLRALEIVSAIIIIIIAEQYQKMGLARRMLAVARDIIDGHNWIGIAGLNSMDYTQSLFERCGYKSAYNIIVYQGLQCQPMSTENLEPT